MIPSTISTNSLQSISPPDRLFFCNGKVPPSSFCNTARTRRAPSAKVSCGLEMRNSHALANQTTYLGLLELLVEDESASRQANGYRSRLDTQKVLDTYDFTYKPQLDINFLAFFIYIIAHQNLNTYIYVKVDYPSLRS